MPAPDGTAYLAFAKARQIAEISPAGAVRILATLPVPEDGGVSTPALGFPLTLGIDRASDGTLYFAYATGTADLTGVWSLRPGDTPKRIAPLPANSLPNGLALNQSTRTLYVANSTGTVWRVPTTGTVWSSDPALAPAGFLGANRLKFHDGAVWATNLEHGTILRIPLHTNGKVGSAQVTATGLAGIDDFAFTGRGNEIIAALGPTNQVALVKPGGTHTVVLTEADGLQTRPRSQCAAAPSTCRALPSSPGRIPTCCSPTWLDDRTTETVEVTHMNELKPGRLHDHQGRRDARPDHVYRPVLPLLACGGLAGESPFRTC